MKRNLVLALATRVGRKIFINHTILPLSYRISGNFVKTFRNILVYRIIFSTSDGEVDAPNEGTFHPITVVDVEIEKSYPAAIELALLSGDFGQEVSQFLLTEFHRMMIQQVTSSGVFNFLVEVDNKFKLRIRELLEKKIEEKSFIKKAIEEAPKQAPKEEEALEIKEEKA